jgi:hypothetical protein
MASGRRRQGAGWCRNSEPFSCDVQQSTHGSPIQHKANCRADRASVSIRLGEHFKRMALPDNGGFALGLARCRRQGASSNDQFCQKSALDDKAIDCLEHPLTGSGMGGAHCRMVDDTWLAPMERAQIVDSIRKIPRRKPAAQQLYARSVKVRTRSFCGYELRQHVRSAPLIRQIWCNTRHDTSLTDNARKCLPS